MAESTEARTTRAEKPDLHGHDHLPFPNFNEDATYLEAVNYPSAFDAGERLQREGFDSRRPFQRVWMRYGLAETDAQQASFRDWGEDRDRAWWECPADHPEAVPFWKDGPANPRQED